MPPFRIPRLDKNQPDAGSKRGREAVEEQKDPTNSVRYEWSTSNCTNHLLHNAHDLPCNLHTRLHEALTKAIEQDDNIKGITIDGNDYKIG